MPKLCSCGNYNDVPSVSTALLLPRFVNIYTGIQVEDLQGSETRRLQGREATLGSLKRMAEAAYPGHKLTPLQSREYLNDEGAGVGMVREAEKTVPF